MASPRSKITAQAPPTSATPAAISAAILSGILGLRVVGGDEDQIREPCQLWLP
jgi:hypothetical protein